MSDNTLVVILIAFGFMNLIATAVGVLHILCAIKILARGLWVKKEDE